VLIASTECEAFAHLQKVTEKSDLWFYSIVITYLCFNRYFSFLLFLFIIIYNLFIVIKLIKNK